MSGERIFDVAKVSAWLFGFALSLFVMVSAYDTMFEDGLGRATFTKGEAYGYPNQRGQLTIVYRRAFTILKDGDVDLIRTVTCVAPDGTLSDYTVPAVRRRAPAGDYPPMKRYIQTPIEANIGDVCTFDSYILWYPRFSIHGRMVQIGTIDFVVKEKP